LRNLITTLKQLDPKLETKMFDNKKQQTMVEGEPNIVLHGTEHMLDCGSPN